MAGISTYASKQLLLATFGKNVTLPATWYVALCTTAPTSSSTGTTIVEPTSAQYSGYTRFSVANDTSHWDQTTGGINLLQIVFPTSAGGASSPVTITSACICDAATLGNMWFFGTFASNLVISSGQAPLFNAGDLNFTIA